MMMFSPLYIFWFLHQTTTQLFASPGRLGCISFDSYIKPQPSLLMYLLCLVVYLLIPTSNHNKEDDLSNSNRVVYLLIPTSNHNTLVCESWSARVVYLLIPTSNHNIRFFWHHGSELYIFWFLHQTTTYRYYFSSSRCCISFDSYIKPQPIRLLRRRFRVVYLLIPTSNHNPSIGKKRSEKLYIFWFLHQTTT